MPCKISKILNMRLPAWPRASQALQTSPRVWVSRITIICRANAVIIQRIPSPKCWGEIICWLVSELIWRAESRQLLSRRWILTSFTRCRKSSRSRCRWLIRWLSLARAQTAWDLLHLRGRSALTTRKVDSSVLSDSRRNSWRTTLHNKTQWAKLKPAPRE